MLAITDYITEIGVGGIFCAVILHIVLTHLEKIKMREVTAKSGATQYLRKDHSNADCTKLSHQITEVHDALLAPPPRDSLVATIRELKEATEEQAQKQKETVHVLEEIRDVLRGHGTKLDAAKCGGCAAADQKKI